MTIPAGAGGDQFPITTTPVTKVTHLTISASFGGDTTLLADHADAGTDTELADTRPGADDEWLARNRQDSVLRSARS